MKDVEFLHTIHIKNFPELINQNYKLSSKKKQTSSLFFDFIV